MIDLLISAVLGTVLLAGCALLLVTSVVPAVREARRAVSEIAGAVRARRGEPPSPSPPEDRGER